MKSELSTTLAKTINTTHTDCMACDDDLRDIVLRKVNKARECGLFLIEAKAAAGHGNWKQWVRDNLRFGEGMALAYMRFARANPQPIENIADGIGSLRDAMVACGALSAPAGHGTQQRGTITLLDKWTTAAMNMAALYNGAREKVGEPSTWPESERLAFKAQLEPLVKVYEEL